MSDFGQQADIDPDDCRNDLESGQIADPAGDVRGISWCLVEECDRPGVVRFGTRGLCDYHWGRLPSRTVARIACERNEWEKMNETDPASQKTNEKWRQYVLATCGAFDLAGELDKPKADIPFPGTGVGMPELMYLEMFGNLVHDAFGDMPYLVGSAMTRKDPRDIDVRLLLSPDECRRLFPEKLPEHMRLSRFNRRWAAICMAWSALGKQLTGLPVDFQIQNAEEANEKYKGRRQALGIPQRLVQNGVDE